MNRVVPRLLLGLLAVLAVMGALLAPRSEAAVYTAKRPGFSILFRVNGDRVTGIQARYTIHCRAVSGDLKNSARHPTLTFDRRDSFKLRPNGRFRKRFKNVTDQVTLDRGIRGAVHKNTVRGSLIDKRFYSFPFIAQFCNSGRSARKPRVHFVARRREVSANGPKAEGAIYTAKRPGFSVRIRTKGKRILDARARYTIHCRPVGNATLKNPVRHPSVRFVAPDNPYRLRGKSFKVRLPIVTDVFTFDFRLRGRVRRSKVHGALLDKRFYSYPYNGGICHSGRRRTKPWVHFTARRQHGSAPGQN